MLIRWLRREESQGVDTTVTAGGESGNFCRPGWSGIDRHAVTIDPSLPSLMLHDIKGYRYNMGVENDSGVVASMS